MRRITSLILVIVFGLPSLFGVGLHALMPHGFGDSSHVHTLSVPGHQAATSGCACDSSQPAPGHEHEEHVFCPERTAGSEHDFDASRPAWRNVCGFTCHGDDCAICFFCMSHKTTLVFAASGVTNVFVVRLSGLPETSLEQIRMITPCGRGPPLGAGSSLA